jgi:hypothetical protein
MITINRETKMYRLVITLLCFFLASCAETSPVVPAVPAAKPEPGEKLILDQEAAGRMYNCNHKKLPFVAIEENEISPLTLHPDEEFHQRFVYTMCPSKTLKTVKGQLDRTISFKGNVIFDGSDSFEFKPGKWNVDAYIKIPPNAEPGAYSFRLTTTSHVTSIKRQPSFRGDIAFFVVKK